MKSWVVHYKNKYPGGQVQASESALDVYDANGDHCVALRKDGSGQFVDKSEEYGAKHAHDLAPIPKDARVFKMVDGKIVPDEKAAERKELAKAYVSDGKVQSCKEIGLDKFDEKQRLLK